MKTFADFVNWAGTQKAAAEIMGLSESMVSLILKGDRNLLPEHAIAIERGSGRLYLAEDLLSEIEFVRNESGEITSYCIRVDAKKDA